MNGQNRCGEFALLLQADVDGELDAAQAAAVTAHRQQCAACAARYRELLALHEALGTLGRETAPAHFRARLGTALAAAALTPENPNARPAAALPSLRHPVWYRQQPWRDLTSLAAGAVLACGLTLTVLHLQRQGGSLDEEIVADHIRAMQASHLLDVASTDQHNVKPWFEGKVNYAPPVKNLADRNFPLLGGRLDYVDGRTVAVTIFQRGKHPINLYAWPGSSTDSTAARFSTQDGYNLVSWNQGGMTLWAISDLNMGELQEFVAIWQSR